MSIPVKKVKGVGPKTAEYLLSKNVETAEALIQFGVKQLAQAPGFSPGRAETVIDEARDMLGMVEPASLAISFSEPESNWVGKKKKKKTGKKIKKKKRRIKRIRKAKRTRRKIRKKKKRKTKRATRKTNKYEKRRTLCIC